MSKLHADWTGDLNDDCHLERYGMHAHVEKMDYGVWWFAISRDLPDPPPYFEDLYNSSEAHTAVQLTTGKMARAAAESCLEVLRQQGFGDD